MENNKNKSLWTVLIVVLVVLAGLIIWPMVSSKIISIPQTPNDEVGAPADSVEDISIGSVNALATSATISYANAIIKYKDTLLQFNKACKASPDKLILKNNTNIMIDNRSPMDRVVKVGSPLNIKAYSFKIVKIESATLPATWSVDCDLTPNVATIVIQ